MKNVGAISIQGIDKSDVFLRERDADRFHAITYYSGAGNTNKTWTGDLKEKDLSWNPKDTLLVDIALTGDDSLRTCEYHVLRIYSPNGEVAEKTFLATTPPGLVLGYNPDRSVNQGTQLLITGEFTSDIIGTPTVTIDVNSTGDLSAPQLMTESGDKSTWKHTFSVPGDESNNGTAVVTIGHAGDCWAGNSAPASNATFIIDNTVPDISSSGLEPQTLNQDTIIIREAASSPPEFFQPADGTWGPAADEFTIQASGDTSRAFTLVGATFSPATGPTAELIITLPATGDFIINGDVIVVTPKAGAVLDIALNAMPTTTITGTPTGSGDEVDPVLSTVVGETQDGTGDTITLTFNEEIRAPDATFNFSTDDFASIESPDGTALDTSNAIFTLTGDRTILIITLNPATAFLVNGNTVSVTPAASEIVDLAGNDLPTTKVASGAIAGDQTLPTIPVANIVGTTIQDTGDTIAITFSEEIKADNGVFEASDFTAIRSPDGSSAIDLTNAKFELSTNKRTLTIKLDEATDDAFLINGNIIAVTPSPGKFLDLAGNALAAVKVVGTTLISGDTAAPAITTNIVGTTIQNTGDTIAITFNEEVRATGGTFAASDFTIESPDDTLINDDNATFVLSTDKKTLTITLNETAPDNAFLKNGDTISFTPAAGRILDLAGNPVANTEVDGTPTNSGDSVAPTLAAGRYRGHHRPGRPRHHRPHLQ